MDKTCQWTVCWQAIDDCMREVPCGKLAIAHVDWGGGVVYFYCAEHYDMRISFIRECGRTDVLRLNGVR